MTFDDYIYNDKCIEVCGRVNGLKKKSVTIGEKKKLCHYWGKKKKEMIKFCRKQYSPVCTWKFTGYTHFQEFFRPVPYVTRYYSVY